MEVAEGEIGTEAMAETVAGMEGTGVTAVAVAVAVAHATGGLSMLDTVFQESRSWKFRSCFVHNARNLKALRTDQCL